MDWDKALSKAIIIIPLAHVVTCALYIGGYSAGFGSGVGALFSPADFFTITLQHLVANYLLSLAIPAIGILARHQTDHKYAADRIAAMPDGETKREKIVSLRRMRQVIWLMASGGPIIAISILYVQSYAGTFIDYYFGVNMALLLAIPLWWKLATLFDLSGIRVELAWCLIAFAAGIVGLGLNSGEINRRQTYAEAARNVMHCGPYAVLAPVGSRFLAVTPDQQRHVIDGDCKERFAFPRTVPFPDESTLTLIKRRWGMVPPPLSPNPKQHAHALLTHNPSRDPE